MIFENHKLHWPDFLKKQPKNDSTIDAETIAKIEEILAALKTEQNVELLVEEFLDKSAEKIRIAVEAVHLVIENQLTSNKFLKPDLIEAGEHKRQIVESARSGRFSSPLAKSQVVRAWFLGKPTPLVKDRETHIIEKIPLEIPSININLAADIDLSVVSGTARFETLNLLIAALSLIDAEVINKQLGKQQVRINKLNVNFELILVGSAGSQRFTLEISPEPGSKKIQSEALIGFRKILAEIKVTSDDFIGTPQIVRKALLVEELIERQESGPSVLIISSRLVDDTKRRSTAGSDRVKFNMFFDDDVQVTNESFPEAFLYDS